MIEERVFAVMIEPPLSVVNGLLEATRRFFGTPGTRDLQSRLVPPERFEIPLIVCSVDAERSPDVVAMALRAAVQDVGEFAVELEPLALVEGADGLIASALRTRDDEVARVVDSLRAAFDRVGLEGAQTPVPFLPVAVVEGAAAIEACAAVAVEARDVPLAGWLVAGLCAAEGVPGPAPGTWLLTRTRIQMLRRPGAR